MFISPEAYGSAVIDSTSSKLSGVEFIIIEIIALFVVARNLTTVTLTVVHILRGIVIRLDNE